MLLQSLHEYSLLGTGVATDGQVRSWRIPRQRRRLEGIFIRVSGVCGTLTTPTTDSYGAVLRRIVLELNDGQKRKAVDVSGVMMLDWTMRHGVANPVCNVSNWGNTAAATFQILYYVPLRPLGLSDPAGSLCGVPLWILNDDPILSVTTGGTEVAATFTCAAGLTIECVGCFRQDFTANPTYIATELVQGDEVSLTGGAQKVVEIPWGGALLGLDLMGFTNAAGTARGEIVAAGGTLQVTYGREVRRQVPSLYFASQMGGLDHAVRAGWNNISDYGVLWNFVDDLPSIGGFSVGSALNLEPVQKGGDLVKLTINPLVAGTPSIRYAYLKAIAGPIDQLKLV